jgi:hypothetical protein
MLLNSVRIACLAFAVASIATPQSFSPDFFRDLHWRCIGPFRGGRTRAATGVPGQPNLFYIGQVNGGVWKSDDYGRTWTPIFDDQPTQSISAHRRRAIRSDHQSSRVARVCSGPISPPATLYKSTDAGKTWTHLGLRDGQQIPVLAIDPRNANRLFAAVLGHPYGANPERGIFRSTDGGQTWQKVLYVDENTGASDVQMDPSNPQMIYASLWEARQAPWEFGNEYSRSHWGHFKSVDGGETWRKLEKGLPADISQVYVAIAPSDSKRLYAALAASKDTAIYRSDDAGENWVRATTDKRPALRIGGGDLPVPKVDPKNPDMVYSTSSVTWRSPDGGKPGPLSKARPSGDDYQNIWINPIPASFFSSATGRSRQRERRANLEFLVQPDRATLSRERQPFPYQVCGGQQESGSVCTSSRGNDGAITFREWHPVCVIEYGYVAPDPLDHDIVYGAGRGQVSKFHWSTGQVEMITPDPLRGDKYRADRTQPIMSRRSIRTCSSMPRMSFSRRLMARTPGRSSAPISRARTPGFRQASAVWQPRTRTLISTAASSTRWRPRSRTSTPSGPVPMRACSG